MPHTVAHRLCDGQPNRCVIRAIAQHDRTAEYRQNALDRHGRFCRSAVLRPRTHRFPGYGCSLPHCLAGVDRVDRFLGLVERQHELHTSGAGNCGKPRLQFLLEVVQIE